MITGSSIRMSQIADAYDLPVDRRVVAQWAKAPIDRYCAPIAQPNGRGYGESLMGDMFERVQRHPITRESLGTSK